MLYVYTVNGSSLYGDHEALRQPNRLHWKQHLGDEGEQSI